MYRLASRVVKGGGPHLDRGTSVTNLGYEESVLFAIRDFVGNDLLLSRVTLTSQGPDGRTYGWHDFASLRVSDLASTKWTLEVASTTFELEFLV